MSLTDHILTQRPDTKWKPVLVTNVVFNVYSTNYPIGTGSIELPAYIRKHKGLHALYKDRNDGNLYADCLCSFRCIALYRGENIKSLEATTNQLFSQWVEYLKSRDISVSVQRIHGH